MSWFKHKPIKHPPYRPQPHRTSAAAERAMEEAKQTGPTTVKPKQKEKLNT